ncbi:prolipoprotein diacylglyceryl transferase [Mycolicibacterium parafortuitum]|uniref:Phosphatidylglycerol--prolipoprotein diacylglyceryl transferase n=1 Tax=Mycolicibacterium parafortuitum TaxID=39692 RepID=A0A375YLL6_MYCPF|nr:prolipoprotein diacylglyceryl transferase [Mycolicibacterium parafortuitum]SRX81939.1 prolipoprotein diacylglyceryl transferase [Mycobacterium leprae TN] [Mycolicibacterium parafortuitum]
MTTTVLAYIPSPPQGVWHLGPFPLRAYALCIIVGIIAALVIGDRRWVNRGGEPGVIYDIALWAVPFGLIGGRVYHVMTDWRTYFGADGVGPAAAFRIWDGGLGIWGAVAFGALGAWIACRRRGIPLPAFGDAIAPGIVLAQAIGRLGNYFNQELYGRATTLPWGLEIYERRNSVGALDSLNGVSTGELIEVVHPTFLYELLWNLLVFAVLIFVDRRFKIGHGRLFALYVAGYCVGRFWIELMRSDTATLVAGIRINTFTATFVFIAAAVYIMVAPKGREAPETLRGDQDAESDVEELAKDVAMASAVGVVAAATVAGQDEKNEQAEREVGGLGSVEGDEAVEAADAASGVHDAAVEGAAETEALIAQLDVPVEDEDEDEDEDEPAEPAAEIEPHPVPEEAGGLGTVEGDEAVEAAEGAAAAGVAVSGDDETEEPADEVEESESAEADEPAAEVAEVDADAVVEGDAGVEVAEAEVEIAEGVEVDEPAAEADEPAAEVAEVDADAVVEGDADVEVDEAAIEAEESEGDADELAEEPAAEVAEVDADVVVEGDADVEVDEAAIEAEESEGDADELAEEPAAEVAEVDTEALTDSDADTDLDGEPEGPTADPTHSYTVVTEPSSESGQPGPGSIVRQWIRRRRNR